MPFCSQCGSQVESSARFCDRCGSPQPASSGPEQARPVDALAGITPRTASILCYVPWLGWIGSIIVLASNRFRNDRNVRFHAFQGLYLFVAWLLDDWVLRPMMFGLPRAPLHHLIQAVLLGASIFMMVKAAHNEPYHLPLLGELAEKSMADQ